MNHIIPLNKLEEALNKQLYGVLREALLLADKTISNGGKVILEKFEDSMKKTVEVFEKKEDLDKWFEKFAGFNKA